MSNFADSLENISEDIRRVLTDRDGVREKVIPLSREVIHFCSITIRTIHRHEFEKAINLLKSASDLLNKTKNTIVNFEEFAHAGYIRDAEKEFAEASTLLAIVTHQELPGPNDLVVD